MVPAKVTAVTREIALDNFATMQREELKLAFDAEICLLRLGLQRHTLRLHRITFRSDEM